MTFNMKYKIAILLAFLILAGCGSAPLHNQNNQRFSNEQKQKLVEAAKKYLGAPYRYGGKSIKGLDCSGFIIRVYAEALGIKLPRTAGDLHNISFQIKSVEAQTGDLVFFRTRSPQIDHVGMMINAYEFIHASASNGVIISNFKDDYYRKTFSGVRRLK